MEPEILKAAGQIAGIGGLALGVLLIIFRDIIHKKIFPGLAEPDAYRLLRLMVVLVWSVALLGIAAWVYVKKSEASLSPGAAQAPVRDYSIAGLVTDAENNGLSDAEVFVIGSEDRTTTKASGSFQLKTKAPENSIVNLRFTRYGYKPRMENVKLPSSGLIVALDSAGSTSQGPSPGNGPSAISQGRKSASPPDTGSQTEKATRKTGRIYIRYAGDYYACSLGLKMRLGQKDIVPVGNLYPVEDVPLGSTDYEITGTILCPNVGMCNALGSGRLVVEEGANYNVIWQNTGLAQCSVRLIAMP